MRLVSFGNRGAEKVGFLIGERIAPLERLDGTYAGWSVRLLLAKAHREHLVHLARRAVDVATIAMDEVRLGPPMVDPGKIVCIGMNYRGHADEQGVAHPEQPLLFCKAATALAGPRDRILLPVEDCLPDYEVELAAVIGRRARHVAEGDAARHVFGYMVGHDVSARRWQKGDGQWFRAKSCDTFYPCGPSLVSADEIDDVGALRLTTTIDGRVLQDSMAGDLIHDVPSLIAYISRYMTLEPGDVISTGTPAGVGCFRDPPRFLQPGDEVVCAIGGLGELRNPVERETRGR